MNTFKVVSDLICPWCYIGKRRLEAALRQLPPRTAVSISWHPFELNPDMPPQGMALKDYCMNKFGSWDRCQQMHEQISEVGETVGLKFRFDLQSTIPNTFDAHRIIWLAGRSDAQDEVVEALFRAYFCEGADFSDPTELIEVAVSAGLQRSAVERLLGSREGAAEVESEQREIKALGVSAVPLFIIKDHIGISGAQPPEVLVKAFKEATATKRKHVGPVVSR